METINNNVEQGTLENFKCPNCSGDITFDSSKQMMVCPYCDCEFDAAVVLEDSAYKVEEDFVFNAYDQMSGSGDWSESEKCSIRGYICNSCAGEVISDDVTVATKCPYCDSPIVVKSDLQGLLKPDVVIPFSVSKEDAIQALKQFTEGKKLLPDLFLDHSRIEEVSGIYVPFWLFSATADAAITFKGTRVSTHRTSNYRVTKTSHYTLYRQGSTVFSKVPADASMKMDDALMDSIEPYHFNACKDFNTSYLSGYVAQKYDVESKEVEQRIRGRMKNTMQDLLKKSVHGYQSVRVHQSAMQATNESIQYALLPVWILNTSYKGVMYTFAINGQTGKIVGELPIDSSKQMKYFGIVFSVVFIIGMLFGKIGGYY